MIPHDDDASRVVVRQWPQEHGVDDAEDGRVRADTERDREDDRGGEPGAGADAAQCISHVLAKRLELVVQSHTVLPACSGSIEAASRGVEGRGVAAEAAHRFGHRLVSRHASARKLFGARREVEGDLLVHLLSRAARAEERESKEPPAAPHDAQVATRAVAPSTDVTASAYSMKRAPSARRCARPAAVSL